MEKSKDIVLRLNSLEEKYYGEIDKEKQKIIQLNIETQEDRGIKENKEFADKVKKSLNDVENALEELFENDYYLLY